MASSSLHLGFRAIHKNRAVLTQLWIKQGITSHAPRDVKEGSTENWGRILVITA